MELYIKNYISYLGKKSLVICVVFGILTSVSKFLFIRMVTAVLSRYEIEGLNRDVVEYCIGFGCIITLFIWSRRTLSVKVINLTQESFWKFRTQILKMILKANVRQVSDARNKISSSLIEDVNTLTVASLNVVELISAGILMISCFIYLFTISLQFFLITLVFTVIGIVQYRLNAKRNMESLRAARLKEDEFIHYVNVILNGFKEIFMDKKKGNKIFSDKVIPVSLGSKKENTKAFTSLLNNQITGQICFFILIALVLFLSANNAGLNGGKIIAFVFTLLYLLGAVESLMGMLPSFYRAGVSWERLSLLMKTLESEIDDEESFDNSNTISKRESFTNLVINDVYFKYSCKSESFSIGPFNFDISKGEIIFIVGGNGSGKSTFLSVLVGVQQADEVSILLNGKMIHDKQKENYRSNFAVVFSDFFIFDEILNESIDVKKFDSFLRILELEKIVHLKGRELNTTKLSQGQRKRLALVQALVEERPILVLDEWAADQDPYFKRKFYMEILPYLKEMGISVVAITHDDAFYHTADKIYKMKDGMMYKVEDFLH